jgi:hypothetical protein
MPHANHVLPLLVTDVQRPDFTGVFFGEMQNISREMN